MTLTIVAIRDPALGPDQILKEPDRYSSHPIVLDDTSLGVLYVKPSVPATPKWLDFFEDAIDPKSLRLKSSSSAAVLLVRRNGKMFAVTFGHGRHMLDPGAIEAGFGLRTALNGIDAGRIRSMDRRTLEAVSMFTREQASRESSLSMFDVNVQRDFLRSVTGSPLDSDLGTRVTGSDALTFTSNITIRTLLAKIDDWFQLSTKTTYQDNFGWVDNLADVRDSTKVQELDALLAIGIRAQAWDRIWLAPPAIVDWDDIGGFKFRTNNESQQVFSELDLSDYFLDHYRSPDDERLLRYLKTDSVFVQSRLHDTYVSKWRVYRCICAEVERDGVTYILNEGKWYRVATDFAATVRTFIDNMNRTSVELPQCENETEGDYNERAAESRQLTLMDKRTVKAAPGQSQIEVCDLYDKETGAFIHVKRYSGSSTLSHLFAQGEMSAQNMVSNVEFRRNARAEFPNAGLEVDSFEPRRHEVAYAIIAKPGKDDVTLPFFSAVNLRNTAEWLKLMGFRSVTLTMIPNGQ
ncbi:MAG: TIGR04141 family sporadically distributed protein [Gammaproteobacteria bacterium]|nr:TIGR04141 family sporadically distributed protein [Gammaproteobacteria bacterium]